MIFDINPAATTPIYQQIVDQVQRLVAGGQLRPGDELPSVRAVATLHAINPMTVSKAYSRLEADGLLARRRGMGMVIAETTLKSSRKATLQLLRPAMQAAADIARQLGINEADALAELQSCLNESAKKGTHERD